ncbi:hypothetical protein [Hydrogenophaga sp.]|uniref:hypothetical protein n=1 Tax=Hydrogenophaga sp. TaxID=1904254 RepID=UPI002722A0A5|nr:hypothetical protein [Hydrogenophaga sp.]MDO9439013.1 hypothetical protein [Hydrogenophaga sp.]
MSDKLERGDTDTKDATLHTVEKMIATALRPSRPVQGNASGLMHIPKFGNRIPKTETGHIIADVTG